MRPKQHSRQSFFERLKKGLEEGIAFCKGEVTLRTVEVPNDPPDSDTERDKPSSKKLRER